MADAPEKHIAKRHSAGLIGVRGDGALDGGFDFFFADSGDGGLERAGGGLGAPMGVL